MTGVAPLRRLQTWTLRRKDAAEAGRPRSVNQGGQASYRPPGAGFWRPSDTCPVAWMPTFSPARSRTTWISGRAAGRIMYFLRSSWTTPAPPNRFQRPQGAASSPGWEPCSGVSCSTRSSFDGAILSHGKKPNDCGAGIPYHEVEALARILLPEIQAFFQSEEGQREFAEWKARQDKEKQD